jgi:dCMP deaminase
VSLSLKDYLVSGENMSKSWEKYFLEMCDLVASKSKDPSTKVGVVIVGPDNEVISTGYNDFPRGVKDTDEERRERPDKYLWTEHAERNAIYNAARIGVSLKGCTMYMNFEPRPCANCMRGVIQAGISRIVGTNQPFPGKGPQWDMEFQISDRMAKEAGIIQIMRIEKHHG